MFQQFYSALQLYPKAFTFLLKDKLWMYLLYPVFISLLMYGVGWSWWDKLVLQLNELIDNIELFKSIPWLQKTISYVVAFSAKIIFVLLFIIFQKYIVLIAMSPLLALLSEAVEEKETNVRYPFNLAHFFSDIVRGIIISVRNFFLEILVLILCFLFSFIPIIGIFVPLVSFFVSSYFWGFSMFDYSNERRRMSIAESTRFVRKNKYASIGNGIVFYLLFAIPVIGFVVAPLVSCIAATLYVLNETKNVNLAHG